MVAFAMDWGWWAVPTAVAVGAGLYYWHAKTGQFTRTEPSEFLTVEEVREALNRGERLVFADVRSESAHNASGTTVQGAVRLHPAHALEDARRQGLPPEARLITFCS